MNARSHLNSPALNRMVLDHLIQQIVSGDHSLADQLGLDSRIREQLMELRSIEIGRLSELRGYLQIQVDVSALSRLLDHLDLERQEERIVKELVRRGAPQSMLRSLFHLSSRDVTALRQAIGLPGSPGRPRQPTEQEEREAWERFQELGLSLDAMAPTDWIRFHDATGIPLRVLWAMVSDWRGPAAANG